MVWSLYLSKFWRILHISLLVSVCHVGRNLLTGVIMWSLYMPLCNVSKTFFKISQFCHVDVSNIKILKSALAALLSYWNQQYRHTESAMSTIWDLYYMLYHISGTTKSNWHMWCISISAAEFKTLHLRLKLYKARYHGSINNKYESKF